jgi:hypothetical protein
VSSRIAHRVAAADEEGERRGETKMKSGEKQAPEPSNVAQAAPLRVPASLEEAYELGWQWQRESFVGLREFGTTKEGVVRREGLALFVSDEAEDIVIPFVATYEFGTPRYPKYPYAGGSVCLIDDDEEHAANLAQKASRGIGKATVQEKQPESNTHEIQHSYTEETKNLTAIWRIKQRFRGRVIFTYTHPEPEILEFALGHFSDAFCDELQLDISELKIKAPSARRRTKKAKARR